MASASDSCKFKVLRNAHSTACADGRKSCYLAFKLISENVDRIKADDLKSLLLSTHFMLFFFFNLFIYYRPRPIESENPRSHPYWSRKIPNMKEICEIIIDLPFPRSKKGQEIWVRGSIANLRILLANDAVDAYFLLFVVFFNFSECCHWSELLKCLR